GTRSMYASRKIVSPAVRRRKVAQPYQSRLVMRDPRCPSLRARGTEELAEAARTRDELNVAESGVLQQRAHLLGLVQRETVPRVRELPGRRWRVEGDHEPSARSKRASDLAECRPGVGPEVHGVDRAGFGELPVPVGDGVDARAPKLESFRADERRQRRQPLGRRLSSVRPGAAPGGRWISRAVGRGGCLTPTEQRRLSAEMRLAISHPRRTPPRRLVGNAGVCVVAAIALVIAAPADRAAASREIRLVRDGGVYEVPVTINGWLERRFILDSGAADLQVSADVFLTLYPRAAPPPRFLPGVSYRLADGRIVSSRRFMIPSLRIGRHEVPGA